MAKKYHGFDKKEHEIAGNCLFLHISDPEFPISRSDSPKNGSEMTKIYSEISKNYPEIIINYSEIAKNCSETAKNCLEFGKNEQEITKNKSDFLNKDRALILYGCLKKLVLLCMSRLDKPFGKLRVTSTPRA